MHDRAPRARPGPHCWCRLLGNASYQELVCSHRVPQVPNTTNHGQRHRRTTSDQEQVYSSFPGAQGGIFQQNSDVIERSARVGALPKLQKWKDCQNTSTTPSPSWGLEGECRANQGGEPQMIGERITRPGLAGLHHDYHQRSHDIPLYPRAAWRMSQQALIRSSCPWLSAFWAITQSGY